MGETLNYVLRDPNDAANEIDLLRALVKGGLDAHLCAIALPSCNICTALAALTPTHPPAHHSSVWPAGCHDPNSCARHKACMYVKCRHDGRSIAGEVESAEAASSIPSAERGTP